ncbi:MAG: phage major capsid protein [Sandarakinorhabdus sp.]|jgi:HK97 family phage major capsid protein|nr:phage major capsid protein [Sandarakinorhabdus sp.]
MSLNIHREKIAANANAFHKVDRTFASHVEQRYEQLKNKIGGGHPADYRRLQSEVADWFDEHLKKASALHGDGAAAANAAEAWIGLLTADIDLLIEGQKWNGATASNAAGWINSKTGQPVNVLGKDDKLAGTSRTDRNVGVGSLLAAMLTGVKTPEIKAALESGTDTAGGFSVPGVVLPEFIDRLRAQSRFIQAGARTIMLDDGQTRILRVATDPAVGWRGENDPVAEGDPTFSALDFNPKSLACLVKVPIELLQDSVNIAEALETALIGAISTELDRACLFGSGSGNQPQGLFAVAGNTVSMGTNGAAPANYDPFLDAMFELESDNVDEVTAAILHPRSLRTFRKLKDAENRYLAPPADLVSLPMLHTTSVPIDQTQGTSSDSSTILVGDFRQAMLGMRQQLVIQRLDQTFAGNLQVAFLAHLRADVGFAQPNAFCKIVGVRP